MILKLNPNAPGQQGKDARVLIAAVRSVPAPRFESLQSAEMTQLSGSQLEALAKALEANRASISPRVFRWATVLRRGCSNALAIEEVHEFTFVTDHRRTREEYVTLEAQYSKTAVAAEEYERERAKLLEAVKWLRTAE